LRSGGRFANPEHDDFRADRRAVVEIDDILDMARQIAKSREGRTSRRLRKKVVLPISNAFSSLFALDRVVPPTAADYVPIFFKNRLHLVGRPQQMSTSGSAAASTTTGEASCRIIATRCWCARAWHC
jgi:hypothetical protein